MSSLGSILSGPAAVILPQWLIRLPQPPCQQAAYLTRVRLGVVNPLHRGNRVDCTDLNPAIDLSQDHIARRRRADPWLHPDGFVSHLQVAGPKIRKGCISASSFFFTVALTSISLMMLAILSSASSFSVSVSESSGSE